MRVPLIFSFLSERTAVILSVQKVVEENIMKVHVADNAFIVLKLQQKQLCVRCRKSAY